MPKKKKIGYKQVNRKLRTYNIICAIFMCLGIAGIAFCLHNLMPMYGDYQYQNRLNHLIIPEITKPTLVEIQIKYINAKPTDIKVTNGDMYVGKVEIEEIDSEKSIFIRFDTNKPSKDYILSLLPQDNYELEYEILQLPSIKYLISDVEFYTDSHNDRWISFSASYPRTEDPISCFVKYQGNRYAPVVYDSRIMQNDKICINVSEITKVKGINLYACDEIQIILSVNSKINPDGPDTRENIIMVSESKTMRLENWPEYDPDTHHDYILTDTVDYISTLGIIPTQQESKEDISEENISENAE